MQMVSVFGLYIWCAASNPADPALLQSKKILGSSSSRSSISIGTSTRVAGEKNETSTEPSSLALPSSAHSSKEQGGKDEGNEALKSSTFVCGSDNSCFTDAMCGARSNESLSEDDKLYCSLCEVEVTVSSAYASCNFGRKFTFRLERSFHVADLQVQQTLQSL